MLWDHSPQHDDQAKLNFRMIKAQLKGRDAGDLPDGNIELIASIMSTMRQRDADVKHGLDPNWND